MLLQADLVRTLKASKPKEVWQPEVQKLLKLKKQLATAQTSQKNGPQKEENAQTVEDKASIQAAIDKQVIIAR